MNIQTIQRIFAHRIVSGLFLLGPVSFFAGLVIAGLAPWWSPLIYYALALVSMAYYRYIRIPHLRRVAVAQTMFGFVNCPHGNYLPYSPCGPCADKWLEDHVPILAQNQAVTPSGETLH